MNVVSISQAGRTVSAFCTACKLEVTVDGSLKCPRCRNEVDPLSLPQVPETHRLAVRAAREAEQAAGEDGPVAPTPEKKAIRLPHRKSTRSFVDQAQRALDDLLAEHKRLTEQGGKLLGEKAAALAAVEAKFTQREAAIAASLRQVARGVDTLRELVERVELRESPTATKTASRPQLGPAHPRYALRLPEGVWCRDFPGGCRRCERSDRTHKGRGLCAGCWASWRMAGKPPLEEWVS